MTLTQDIFLAFSRFVSPAGREAIFVKGASPFTGYDALLQQVKDMDSTYVIPDLNDYVFGANDTAINKRIAGLHSYFLFLDYGSISSSLDAINRIHDSFSLAITIAYPLADFDGDLVEQVIISDSCLDKLLSIRRELIKEEKERYWLKDMAANHTIVPWIHKERQCIGWTILFDRQGFDMLQGKTL
jgi:hypothetical protein